MGVRCTINPTSLPTTFSLSKHLSSPRRIGALALMATAGEGSYEVGGGGKFRKRPFRRPQTTPYDRPPNSLRNTRNGWLSKVVDPASRLITASAHRFFDSVFRRRLPPPPFPVPSPSARVWKFGCPYGLGIVWIHNCTFKAVEYVNLDFFFSRWGVCLKEENQSLQKCLSEEIRSCSLNLLLRCVHRTLGKAPFFKHVDLRIWNCPSEVRQLLQGGGDYHGCEGRTLCQTRWGRRGSQTRLPVLTGRPKSWSGPLTTTGLPIQRGAIVQ
ncbi:Nuclear pore complex protein NUP1 [Vitis vinifera]|uniref:Nuclear pore complex protein NUP1 n=1 Tax=Vitis vinifera TaxID=29760 RepID=A0A438H2A8_VITVI|nr:Nuclear pore complex protein NUP1 [Vitis vinifera]